MKIKITIEVIPLYKKLGPKIKKLKSLSLSNNEIARTLKLVETQLEKALTLKKKYIKSAKKHK